MSARRSFPFRPLVRLRPRRADVESASPYARWTRELLLPPWARNFGMTELLVTLVTVTFVVPVVLDEGTLRRFANDVPFTLILLAAAVVVFARLVSLHGERA